MANCPCSSIDDRILWACKSAMCKEAHICTTQRSTLLVVSQLRAAALVKNSELPSAQASLKCWHCA
eukprot:5704391-Amphidinium_carterae.1